MKLELWTYQVEKVCFAGKSEIGNGVLYIDKEELKAAAWQDARIKDLKIDLACPGERARIIHTLDIVEPRTKREGLGSIFPGFLGPPRLVGEGRTTRLAGVAVVEAGQLPYVERGLFYARERIIDMSGPGASCSPFSKTFNFVLAFRPSPDVAVDDYDAAIRLAGLRAAKYLADVAITAEPSQVEVFQLGEEEPVLPRVAYIYQISSTGPLADTYLYGEKVRRLFPTVIHPNEIMDGALVSGRYPPYTIPTYIHCNNPVIRELYRCHGQELQFAGVILLYGGGLNTTGFAKERAASYAAQVARLLKADGAILTQEGGGNSIMDQMLICQHCEELGIKTTLVTYEMSGATGIDPPLIYMVPEADAVVSTGNREEKVLLPAVDRVLGGDKILFTGADAKEEIEVFVEEVASSIDQAGSARMTARQY